MRFNELIRKKRDGETLSQIEIFEMAAAISRHEIPDYQISAWLMAVYFRGLSARETADLTHAMWKTGTTLPKVKSNARWIDKHSTGGVGDKTSMLLVPIVIEACAKLFGKSRVKIPMVSGRGLGFSGGTLDKMESVPGFNAFLSMEEALSRLEENGFFMIGQTAEIAPVDRTLYALRDATETVESIPLIVASILSKKLSENLDALVLDVKVGSGAFMTDIGRARELAKMLCGVAATQNVKAVAVLTRMEEPLGRAVGNLLEVKECAEFFQGDCDPGLVTVTLALATEMVLAASPTDIPRAEAQGACQKVLEERSCWPTFRKMFESQHGNWQQFERDCEALPRNRAVWELKAPNSGYIAQLEASRIAQVVGQLGGGRTKKEDRIDPWVGITVSKKVGDSVNQGETVMKVHFKKESDPAHWEAGLQSSLTISARSVSAAPWILETHR